MRVSSFRRPAPLLLLAAFGCGTGDGGSETQINYADTRVELQDIFVSDRLVELPVLPEGTLVHNEIVIHNAGDRDLIIDGIELNYQSDENWVLEMDSPPTLEAPLKLGPHAFLPVEVAYNAVADHDTFAALDIYSDDPDEAEMTVAFIGRSASGGPEARVSETIIDFGFQYRGIEKRHLVEVRNEGEEPLWITSIELQQAESETAFWLTCPGIYPLSDCDFATERLPTMLAEPILPGGAQLLELAFTPQYLQARSAQLKIGTSDPLRPEFVIHMVGNGDNAGNCTPPTLTVSSPSEATYYHLWESVQISARIADNEQPPHSMYVEVFLGDLLIEDEFPDATGLVQFDIDIDEHEPPLPAGLLTLTLKATDGCQLHGYDVAVVAIDFPLSQGDVDADGYDAAQGDCDQNDAQIFPQAVERLNGKDDDCDGTIDERTAAWDDDCDGYCEHGSICLGQGPEVGDTMVCDGLADAPYGDCNDGTTDVDFDGDLEGPSIFPAAHEILNFVDDNCDGVVDEGTTFADDDRDGQTEATGDCDDADDGTFLGALEWCDGQDDDCDGVLDDDCADPNEAPRVIGGIITKEFQVKLGSVTECDVIVVSPDDNLTYEWTTDFGTFDQPAVGSHVVWRAPTPEEAEETDLDGEFATLLVRVVDSLGQQAYGFGNVLMRQEIQVSYSPVARSDDCNTGRGSATGWALALLFLAVRTRRRP